MVFRYKLIRQEQSGSTQFPLSTKSLLKLTASFQNGIVELFNVALHAARPVLAERRDAGLITLVRTILSKRFGAKREIKNVALIPAKILATHQLSSSPN